MKKIKLLLCVASVGAIIFGANTVVYAQTNQVTGLKQTDASDTSVDVEWNAQTGCDYDIQISADGVNYQSKTDYYYSSNTEYIYNLTAGNTYYVRVRATEDDGTTFGSFSAPLKVVTKPAKPANFKQTGLSTNSATVSWSASKGATSYRVYGYINGAEKLIATTSSTSYTIKGLSNAKKVPYSWLYVCAVADGQSYKSESYDSDDLMGYNVQLIPPTPTAPKGNLFFLSSKEVWFDNPASEYADSYEYVVYNSKNKKIKTYTVDGQALTAYIKKISGNEFFKIQCRAIYKFNGVTKKTSWSKPGYFAQQSKINIKKASSGKSYKINWSKVKGAKTYTLYMGTSSKGKFTKVATTKKLTYTVNKYKKKKLNSKKKYYFYVVANKKVGSKTYKSDASVCWYSLY